MNRQVVFQGGVPRYLVRYLPKSLASRLNQRLFMRFCAPLCSIMLLFFASAAYGHGVYITAWHDTDSVCTESYYSRKNRVIGGTVVMRGADGTVLGEASTNIRGIACFSPRPQKQDLTFQVDASPGHRATCSLSAALAITKATPSASSASAAPSAALQTASVLGIQINETVAISAPQGGAEASAQPAQGRPEDAVDKSLRREGPGHERSEYKERRLERDKNDSYPNGSYRDDSYEGMLFHDDLLRSDSYEGMLLREEQSQLREIQGQLREIQGQLRDMQGRGAGFRGIVGGIGWIIGLFALVGYLRHRRHKKQIQAKTHVQAKNQGQAE